MYPFAQCPQFSGANAEKGHFPEAGSSNPVVLGTVVLGTGKLTLGASEAVPDSRMV